MNSKIKVLLVDDNAMIRIYFRDIFWVHGLESHVELETAEDVNSAWEKILDVATRPEIVFLDLSMPLTAGGRPETESGFELLKKIKDQKEFKDIKVVIFSGFNDQVFKTRAKELGANDYLVKDENLPQDLVKFVSHIVKEHAH